MLDKSVGRERKGGTQDSVHLWPGTLASQCVYRHKYFLFIPAQIFHFPPLGSNWRDGHLCSITLGGQLPPPSQQLWQAKSLEITSLFFPPAAALILVLIALCCLVLLHVVYFLQLHLPHCSLPWQRHSTCQQAALEAPWFTLPLGKFASFHLFSPRHQLPHPSPSCLQNLCPASA